MGRRIKLITRRELTAAIRLRYEAADRNSKKAILDEFVKVTGYHRKHAIRILTTDSGDQPKRQGGHRVYQDAVKEAMIVLWEASDRICGKRRSAKIDRRRLWHPMYRLSSKAWQQHGEPVK